MRVAKLFEGKKFAEGRFADGVISASVMFTVGAMAIMGSLDAGLRGNYSVLFTKTAIDGVAAAAMSAAMGIGVVLSLVPVLIWEGLLILAGRSPGADTQRRGRCRDQRSRRRDIHRHGA